MYGSAASVDCLLWCYPGKVNVRGYIEPGRLSQLVSEESAHELAAAGELRADP